MSLDIIRFVAHDWDEAAVDLAARGADGYWLNRDDNDEPVCPAWATAYDGPLSNCPASRFYDAMDWCQMLLAELTPADASRLEQTLGPLFLWDLPQRSDLEALAGAPGDVWAAWSPPTVVTLRDELRALRLDRWETRMLPGQGHYLPAFEDFEGHLSNFAELLVYAAKRGAGVVSLTSL